MLPDARYENAKKHRQTLAVGRMIPAGVKPLTKSVIPMIRSIIDSI